MKPTLRHNARRSALQALYQWQVSGGNLGEIEQNFLTFRPELAEQTQHMDVRYFGTLLHEIPAILDTLDNSIQGAVDRQISKLDLLELMILRIGTYELLKGEVPAATVINEAVELAKTFAGEDSYKYVNAVLDVLKRTFNQPAVAHG